MGFELIALFELAALWGCFAAWAGSRDWVRLQRWHRAWADVAKLCAGADDAPPCPDGLEPRRLRLSLRQGEKRKDVSVVATLDLSDLVPEELMLTRHAVLGEARALLYGRDTETGDARFDRVFVVNGPPEPARCSHAPRGKAACSASWRRPLQAPRRRGDHPLVAGRSRAPCRGRARRADTPRPPAPRTHHHTRRRRDPPRGRPHRQERADAAACARRDARERAAALRRRGRRAARRGPRPHGAFARDTGKGARAWRIVGPGRPRRPRPDHPSVGRGARSDGSPSAGAPRLPLRLLNA